MPRKKLEDRNVRKIIKTSNKGSYCITVPIEYMRKLGWKEKQKVVVSLKGSKLQIEDWKD